VWLQVWVSDFFWWWVWFILFWGLLLSIICFVVWFRFEFYNPILNSFRISEGKIGDFVVAIIPILWYCMIMVNSSNILSTADWQFNTSILILRIQGKQRYWVYKFDVFFNSIKNIMALRSVIIICFLHRQTMIIQLLNFLKQLNWDLDYF
jgi:hypothetical protein